MDKTNKMILEWNLARIKEVIAEAHDTEDWIHSPNNTSPYKWAEASGKYIAIIDTIENRLNESINIMAEEEGINV